MVTKLPRHKKRGIFERLVRRVYTKQGRKRPLDTPKRMIKRREREERDREVKWRAE